MNAPMPHDAAPGPHNRKALTCAMSPALLLGLFLVTFGLWGAFLVWRWAATRHLAGLVYAAKRDGGELAAHVSQDVFRRAFMASEGPRAATHVFVAAVICTLAIPPLMSVFTALWHEVWLLTNAPEELRKGTMVHTFCLFLLAMGTMVAVLWQAMKRYHVSASPPLATVIRRLNGATA